MIGIKNGVKKIKTGLSPSSNFLEDLSTILECQINTGGIIEK